VNAGSTEVTYIRYEAGQPQPVSRPVAREALVTLYVNGNEWMTFLCTPLELSQLVVGFLHTEGIISSPDDIALLRVCDEAEGEVHVQLVGPVDLPTRRVLTSGCGGGTTFADLAAKREPLSSDQSIAPLQVMDLMADLYRRGTIHTQAGGVHTSALSDSESLLMVIEDVGRHNTLDKILGRCLLTGQETRDHILLTTGRVSTEMLNKAAHMRVPIVISRTSPTDLAVELARDWGITLIGYVRGRSFNVYAGEWRLRDTR
jgi:FdhD protein